LETPKDEGSKEELIGGVGLKVELHIKDMPEVEGSRVWRCLVIVNKKVITGIDVIAESKDDKISELAPKRFGELFKFLNENLDKAEIVYG